MRSGKQGRRTRRAANSGPRHLARQHRRRAQAATVSWAADAVRHGEPIGRSLWRHGSADQGTTVRCCRCWQSPPWQRTPPTSSSPDALLVVVQSFPSPFTFASIVYFIHSLIHSFTNPFILHNSNHALVRGEEEDRRTSRVPRRGHRRPRARRARERFQRVFLCVPPSLPCPAPAHGTDPRPRTDAADLFPARTRHRVPRRRRCSVRLPVAYPSHFPLSSPLTLPLPLVGSAWTSRWTTRTRAARRSRSRCLACWLYSGSVRPLFSFPSDVCVR